MPEIKFPLNIPDTHIGYDPGTEDTTVYTVTETGTYTVEGVLRHLEKGESLRLVKIPELLNKEETQ